jgi:hypothetical protein
MMNVIFTKFYSKFTRHVILIRISSVNEEICRSSGTPMSKAILNFIALVASRSHIRSNKTNWPFKGDKLSEKS